jgi:RES domain-containing protein
MAAEMAWVPVAGIWVRQSRPNLRGDEAAAYSARWQGAGMPAAYFADSEATAWAELYRGLAERRIGPGDVFPRDLHHVRVALERVADLRTEAARRALGLPRIRQTSLQWPSFQAVGEQLAAEGAQGILYSSAARTRSLCLCVFEAGLLGLTIEGESLRVLAPPPPPRGLRT